MSVDRAQSYHWPALTRLGDSKFIGMAINSTKVIQVDEYPTLLTKRENPIVTMEGKKYQNLMKDLNGNPYSLYIEESARKFSVAITDINETCCFRRDGRSVVRIQPLTNAEAEKAHSIANPILDVFYV